MAVVVWLRWRVAPPVGEGGGRGAIGYGETGFSPTFMWRNWHFFFHVIYSMPIDWSQLSLEIFFVQKKKNLPCCFKCILGITFMKMGPNFLSLFTFEDIIILLHRVESHSCIITCKKNIFFKKKKKIKMQTLIPKAFIIISIFNRNVLGIRSIRFDFPHPNIAC